MTAKKKLSRREFLGNTLAGVAAAGMLKLDRPAVRSGDAGTPAAAPGPFVTRALGKTGFRLPVVSMGVMNADLPSLVHRAYEAGMRHFDTAASYARGRNEEMVGRVIKELGVRDQVVIATKVMGPPWRQGLSAAEAKAKFLRMLDESLRRLQVKTVDIVYVHDVSEVADVAHPGLLEAMAQAKKEQKARCVGFSTHANMAECLNEAVRLGSYDVVLTAWNYSLHADGVLLKAMKAAASSGLGLVAMKTQCQQDWYQEGLPADTQSYYRGTIVHPALLKWALNNDFIGTAVPGFVNFDQLDQDIACARTLDYTPEERKFLEDRKVKLALASVCRQCGSCRASCPHGADVPGLMRVHMYARNYGNLDQARETLSSTAAGRSLALCRTCPSCEASCAGRVRVGRRIEFLKEVMA